MQLTFIDNSADDNMAEQWLSPALYFPEWAGCRRSSWQNYDLDASSEPLIIGGSGLLHPGYSAPFVKHACNTRQVICWGIGYNVHQGQEHFEWRPFVSGAALVGMRDRFLAEREANHEKFFWTPCLSTMHPAFDAIRPNPMNGKTIVCEHLSFPTPDFGFPKFGNRTAETNGPEQFLKKIEGFETVLTNSYPASLWSSVAGRRVVVWRPFSSKFFTGLPALFMAQTEAEVAKGLTQPIVFVNRETLLRKNQDFAERVRRQLKQWNCS